MTLKLLRDGTLVDGCETVGLSDYLQDPAAWSNLDPANWSVMIAPEDDLAQLPAAVLELPTIYLAIPVYTDGRAYTHARTLRMQHGYAGELIAAGDIRRDQVEFMRRVGIETIEFTGRHTVEELTQALHELDMQRPHRYYSGGAVA